MPVPEPSTALAALTRRRFLRSGWPWRSLAYLATSVPLMIALMLPAGLLAVPFTLALVRIGGGSGDAGTPAALALVGAALVALFGPPAAVALAHVERLRLRLVDTRPATSGHRPASGPSPSPWPWPWPWLRTRYTEAATWRELAYLALLGTVGPAVYAAVAAALLLIMVLATGPVLVDRDGPISLGFTRVTTVGQAVPYALVGLALAAAVPYLLATLAGGHAAVARTLLTGRAGDRTEAALIEVSRSRARLVDAFEAERRRIERDLHDGAQQRLISLTLRLGLARLDLPDSSPAARSVTLAHDEAKQLMVELRELIRGIHPKVLTDLGLAVALQERADQCPVPVSVQTDLPGRLPVHVEATAYFVVAEALTNVVKHSGATAATVTAHQLDDVLTVRVADNGCGAAEPGRGTGLVGLGDRVAVSNGRMLVSSPVGGPTVIHVELPCTPDTRSA